MPDKTPIQSLPDPRSVSDHIGRLLNELHIARRLLKLSREARDRLVLPAAERTRHHAQEDTTRE